jgi:tetratricopeptide (TPR) repeat protein
LEPGEYRYREALARQLMANKEYEEALTQYTEAAKLAPNTFFAEQMADQQIEIYRRQGTLVEKIEALETAPETFDQQKQLAKMYRKLGNITHTMKALLKAKELQPDDVLVNRWLADIYAHQNMRDEATAIYAHLIEIDRANAREYYAGISRSHLKGMDFDAATDAARQVVAHSPHNPEGYQMLAEIAKHAGNYNAAVDSLKQVIRLRPEATEIRAELAEIYKLAGNTRRAVEQYWRCWALSNSVNEKLDFVKPLFEAYNNMEQGDEFEERLEQMSKANPYDMGPVLALAEVYRIKKDLSSARFQLGQALELERENPKLLAQLVEMSLELGDMQDALSYQQRLVKAQPNPLNQQLLGELLFDVGREQEAIQAWTKLLYTKNQTVEAELRLATLLIQHVLLDEALSTLDRAGQKATDAESIYQVGATLAGMNEFDRASPYFDRILQMPKPPKKTTQNVTRRSRRPTYGPPGINMHRFERVQSLYPLIQMQIFRGEMLKQLKNQSKTNSALRAQRLQRFGGSMWQPWKPNSFEDARAGALVQLMIIAQWQGKSREFIQQFEAEADANPRDILTLERLAQLYILTENSDKTKEITQRLIAASPNDLVYHAMRLDQSMQENLDYETVKKYIDEMSGVALQARLWYIAQYARRLYLQQKKTAAAKLLDEFGDAKVTDPRTASQLVRVFAEMGNIDAAERLIAQLPNQAMSAVSRTSILDKATHLYLARTYERHNMVDKAIAQYEKISELEPNNVRWYITITNLYERLHRTDKARQLAKTVALYKKAIKIVPTSFELHYLLATTYAALDQSSEAEVVYRRALDLSLKAHEHDSVLRSIWELYADHGQQDKGIAILEELKSELETSLVLHELLGNAYKAAGDSEKADAAYTEWLAIRQKSVHRQRAWDYRDLAEALLNRDILPEKALAFAERAAQIGPAPAYASTLGRAYLANERYEEALEQFKRGINSMNHPGMTAEYVVRQLWSAGKNVTDKGRYIAMVEKLMSTMPDNPTIQQLAALVEYYRKQEQSDKAKDATNR